jgi:hypothetical protein
LDTDDLRASISAVEQEVSRDSSSIRVRKRQNTIPWKLIVGVLVLFIVVDWLAHHKSGSQAEDDLNHMMQQARHEMIDFYDRWGTLPSNIPNPALKPYISIEDLGGGRFRLEGQLGDATQTLEGP